MNLNLRWLRIPLIISPLLLSAFLAFRGSSNQLMLVVNMVLGAGAIVSFLRWPSLGLIAAVVGGIFVPYLGPSGLNVTMILIALLLGLWLLEVISRKREIRLVSSPPVWALLAFAVVALLAFAIGQLPWFTFAVSSPMGAQLGGLTLALLSVGTFLVVANRVRSLAWLSRITWVFLAAAVLYFMTRSLLPQLGLSIGNRLLTAGSVFYIWLVAIPFSQALINRDLHPFWRTVLFGVTLSALYFLYFNKFADKSGWLPAFVAVFIILALRSWRLGLLLAVAGFLFSMIFVPQVLASDSYSVATRLDAWIIMAEIIKVNPIFGLGFANYYWYTPLFPIRGYAVSFNSHNNYLDIIAQTGLVGLVCYLWFFWEVGKLGLRLRDQVPGGFAQAYVYGALGGLVATLVTGMLGDWVLPFFYNIGLNGFRTSMLSWLFLGGLVSLDQMQQQAKART